MDRRYGETWLECAFIHVMSGVIVPFVVLMLIIFIPVAIFWKEDGVDPRSANEINADLS